MQVNIKRLIDDAQCYQTVRALRSPEGVVCPPPAVQQAIQDEQTVYEVEEARWEPVNY